MTVAIKQLTVPRQHRTVFKGQIISIMATFVDIDTTERLLDIGNIPLLTLFNPVGTILVINGEMSHFSTGIYTFTYQTTALDIPGVYTANVDAVYADTAARLSRVVVFKVIDSTFEPEVFSMFNYLAIKDQDGEIWYWFINVDNTPDFSTTIPFVVAKVASAIVTDNIPYWIEVLDEADDIRYIYPSVAGEYTVTAIQPAIGFGLDASPVWIGISASMFSIDVNEAEEVILNFL